jgi:KDO2-lipid IV(A) lauroyltransferase
MDFLLYWPARALIGILQSLPLVWVAHIGRAFGGLAYLLDGRHRRKTIENLKRFIGEGKSDKEIAALARETFRRIGENFSCAVKTASMSWEDLRDRCEIAGVERVPIPQPGETPGNFIVAIGHFGNFELWARMNQLVRGYQFATTYRGLRPAALDRLLQEMRRRSGCLFFERRSDGAALKAALAQSGLMLGILSDQHAGDNGLPVAFFGRLCSTTAAPAVFALRYRCPLHVGLCYRTAPGRWRLEVSQAVPILENGKPRSTADIMLDVNKIFEAAVLRDPANWFWVHNRWKLKIKSAEAATSQPKGPS